MLVLSVFSGWNLLDSLCFTHYLHVVPSHLQGSPSLVIPSSHTRMTQIFTPNILQYETVWVQVFYCTESVNIPYENSALVKALARSFSFQIPKLTTGAKSVRHTMSISSKRAPNYELLDLETGKSPSPQACCLVSSQLHNLCPLFTLSQQTS